MHSSIPKPGPWNAKPTGLCSTFTLAVKSEMERCKGAQKPQFTTCLCDVLQNSNISFLLQPFSFACAGFTLLPRPNTEQRKSKYNKKEKEHGRISAYRLQQVHLAASATSCPSSVQQKDATVWPAISGKAGIAHTKHPGSIQTAIDEDTCHKAPV